MGYTDKCKGCNDFINNECVSLEVCISNNKFKGVVSDFVEKIETKETKNTEVNIICFKVGCEHRNIYSCQCLKEVKNQEMCKDWEPNSPKVKENIEIEGSKNIKPNYYHKGNIDTIKFCIENKLDFLQGSIVKYVVRYKEKNGLEDLNKAMEFLKRLIESEVK